jgi:hypothetical protein
MKMHRATRFFQESQEGFSFEEEREYSDKQEQADNNFIWSDDIEDIPDDIDTWLDLDIN